MGYSIFINCIIISNNFPSVVNKNNKIHISTWEVYEKSYHKKKIQIVSPLAKLVDQVYILQIWPDIIGPHL